MLRALAALVVALGAFAAAPAAAACAGPGLVESLPAAERAVFDATVAAVPYGEGLVWRAARGDARILLVGTMHLADPRHAPLLAALGPRLDEADLLLLEVSPEGEAQAAAALAADAGLTLSQGPTLPERLDPADWDALAAAARARGVPPMLVARMRPWMVLATLAVPPCLVATAAAGTAAGLDGMLRDRARAAGVAIEALEPWDTVFRLADSLDAAVPVEALADWAGRDDLARAAMVSTLDAYFAGRLGEVGAIDALASARAGLPEGLGATLDAALLDARNAAWMPVIEAASARAPRLVVAAGGAHLPGAAGVLARLAAAGWAVAPADPAAPAWDPPPAP